VTIAVILHSTGNVAYSVAYYIMSSIVDNCLMEDIDISIYRTD
jgi:hypothetical protein